MRARWVLVVVGAVVAMLAAGAVMTASAGASHARTPHLIAFNGCTAGNEVLYVIRADGTGLRRLTKSRGRNESSPSWSPDGAWLVFNGQSTTGHDQFGEPVYGANHLSLLKLGESRARQLIRVPGGDDGGATPAWSPDGRRIAFGDYSDVAGFSSGGIYLVGRDGKNLSKIPDTSNEDHSPSWSPDGKTIAFDHGTGGIEVVGIDGKGRLRLTNRDGDSTPAWSPDGRLIAFSRRDVHDNDNIWVMNADGRGQHQLTGAAAKQVPGPQGGVQPGHATEPAWSPTGRQIAFVELPSKTGQLYVMDANGSHPHPMRRGIQMCGGLNPDWQR